MAYVTFEDNVVNLVRLLNHKVVVNRPGFQPVVGTLSGVYVGVRERVAGQPTVVTVHVKISSYTYKFDLIEDSLVMKVNYT